MPDADDESDVRLPVEYAGLMDAIGWVKEFDLPESTSVEEKLEAVARRVTVDTVHLERRWKEVVQMAVANGELAAAVVPLLARSRGEVSKPDLQVIAAHFRGCEADSLSGALRLAVYRVIASVYGDEDADAWHAALLGEP